MKIKHSLVAVTLLSTASFSSFAAPSYSIMDLGFIHEGDRSSAYGISDTGLVVGNSRGRVPTGPDSDARTNTHAARFYAGQDYVEDIGGMGYTGGHGGAQAVAINDAGLAVGYGRGYSLTGERFEQAFVNHYQSGYMQNIGTLGGKEARAYGINNSGKVVGWSNTAMGSGEIAGFVHDNATNTMTGLATNLLGGTKSFAFDINNNDLIVGNATTGNGSGAAFMYQYGGAIPAVDMGSLAGSGYAEARAVNDNAEATGWSKVGLVDTAFIYDAATGMEAIAGLGGASRGYDINDDGTVVGYADDGVTVDSRGRAVKEAVIEIDGQFVKIYDLLTPEQQALWKGLTEARSINNDGTIVGTGMFWTDKANDRYATMAFQVTAVPVPGAIFFMGPALGLLGFMGKRRSPVAA